MTTKRGKKEAFVFKDKVTGRQVLQLTAAEQRSVHGYYDLRPWSPTTGRVAFTSMATPDAEEGDVYVMDRDGDNLTYLAHSRAVSPNGGARVQWTYDGRRVCYKDREGDQRLVAWVDVETGAQGSYPGDLRMVSPTSNLNAYHTNRGDYPDHEVLRQRGEHGVFVQDLDTGESKRVATVEECWQIHPRREEIADWHLFVKHTKWSPDGTRLMFVFCNANYHPKYGEIPWVKDVYVVNADGTALKRVGEFGGHPLWHPNGEEILSVTAFEGQPGRRSLVLHNVETGEKKLATTAIAGHGHPSFSPDGKSIVLDYVRGSEGTGSLCLVDVEANEVEELVSLRVTNHSHTGTHLHPVWSWDGEQILYASDASGVAQLCVIDV